MFSVIRDCLKKPFPISPCRARYPLRSRLYWGDSYSNLMDGDILLSVLRSLHCSLCFFFLFFFFFFVFFFFFFFFFYFSLSLFFFFFIVFFIMFNLFFK